MSWITKTTKPAALAAVIAAGVGTGASAATVTVDFTGEAFGPITGNTYNLSIAGLDISFSASSLLFRGLGAGFTAEYGLDVWLSTNGDVQPITMEISGATINAVTFLNPINGTVTSEVDVIRAEAFDSGAVLVDSLENSNELNTLTGDIASIVFDDVSTGYVLGEFVIDFDRAIAPVPLPASLPLLLAGLGGLALMRRKQKR